MLIFQNGLLHFLNSLQKSQAKLLLITLVENLMSSFAVTNVKFNMLSSYVKSIVPVTIEFYKIEIC